MNRIVQPLSVIIKQGHLNFFLLCFQKIVGRIHVKNNLHFQDKMQTFLIHVKNNLHFQDKMQTLLIHVKNNLHFQDITQTLPTRKIHLHSCIFRYTHAR